MLRDLLFDLFCIGVAVDPKPGVLRHGTPEGRAADRLR